MKTGSGGSWISWIYLERGCKIILNNSSFVNQSKIVHIIIDDLVDSQQAKSNIW